MTDPPVTQEPPAVQVVDPQPGFWDLALSPGILVPSLIAIAAAGIAVWSALVARGARNATVSQADTARAALEDQRAERYEQAAPRFEVSIDQQTQVRPAGARIRMIAGPPRVLVTITWEISFTWLDPGEGRPGDRTVEIRKEGVYSASMCKGATIVVHHEERPDAILMIALARYKIKSIEESDDRRTWHDEHMSTWAVDTVDEPTTGSPAVRELPQGDEAQGGAQ
ncbi:hypothetical protein [Pseudonocardia alni]|uniref:Uncharacterized protein n=1 Tax=Pseudonocardia alni TaxID=33907 RepID=A0A852VWG3_PSEA5|nr:hypothetical protein [Pseudonocardia antarctica]NYG00360.1 hypothetical protein [Pseudonocardia antarctica]